jgi:N-acetylglucosamine-6-phosphate deacetylase
VTRTLIHSARRFDEPERSDAWVLFDGDTIAATGHGEPVSAAGSGAGSGPGSTALPAADHRVDAGGALLAPGFIDMHGHGGGGVAFDDGTEAIATALATHRRHGTTRSVLSLVTAHVDVLARRLQVVAEAAAADPLIVGAHLEGPFLAAGHKGAHDPALLRAPTPSAIDTLIEAGADRIVQLTLAPELPGGHDAIARLTGAGVAVGVGHTDAGYDEARAAFDLGASILTHAFNGMDDVGHRAPGPVAAAMDAGGVTLELICDGAHVHPAVSRLAFAGAPGRIALITDAMAAAGSDDGDYLLGSLQVEVRAGVARLAGGGSIAGSTLTMDAALRHAVQEVGVPLATAVRALTEVPARAIGRAADLGRIARGFAADAVLLDDDLTISGVWAAGARVA